MTTITLEFSDEVADLYRTRLADGWGYKDTIDDKPNPQTRDEFLVEKLHGYLLVECKSFERIHRTETTLKSDIDQYEAAIVEATPVLKAKAEREAQQKADEVAAIQAIIDLDIARAAAIEAGKGTP